jgi:uncharacterized protein (DUF1330 family)
VTVTLCVLLWSVLDREDEVASYEDQVLELLGEHGGQLLSRVKAVREQPCEVQIIAFESEDGLSAYMNSPERAALSASRDRAIARTEVLRVDVLHPPESRDQLR